MSHGGIGETPLVVESHLAAKLGLYEGRVINLDWDTLPRRIPLPAAAELSLRFL